MRKSKPGSKYGLSFIRVQTPNLEVKATNEAIDPIQVDLQLDFESNEVFDIARIRSWIYFINNTNNTKGDVSAVDNNYDINLAVAELPNFNRNVRDETVIESDPTIIHFQHFSYRVQAVGAAGQTMGPPVSFLESNFIDWYTVADDITLAMDAIEGSEQTTFVGAYLEIFGRRRRAPEKEFRILMNQLRR